MGAGGAPSVTRRSVVAQQVPGSSVNKQGPGAVVERQPVNDQLSGTADGANLINIQEGKTFTPIRDNHIDPKRVFLRSKRVLSEYLQYLYFIFFFEVLSENIICGCSRDILQH